MTPARSPKSDVLADGQRQLRFTDFMEKLARKAEGPDPRVYAGGLFGVVLALMGLGLLIQASHAATIMEPGAYHHELVGQLLFRLAGLCALFFGYFIGPKGFQRFLPYLVALTLFLLVACFIPGLSVDRNGSNRWVQLGITFQPSELARIAIVLWVADRCMRLGERVHDLKRGVLPTLALVLLFFALVLIETDLGGALLLLFCALATMWVGGGKPFAMAMSAFTICGGAITAAVAFHPYVRQRVAIFFGQSHNSQVSESVGAFASGGSLGQGLGLGVLRQQGVPYLESDYVFAQWAEEFGLFGTMLLLGLLLAFLWFAMRYVLSLRDKYEALAAFGLLISIGLQGMLHVQVVVGLAPPKGMTLPFISDGGTSLIVSSLAVGLALGASRRHTLEISTSCNLSNATA